MAYVYQHIRLDTNEVFYVGIATEKQRIYSKQSRNIHWKRTVKKYGYKIIILHKDITWEEACIIEKSLISSYGRRDLSSGTLVNLTDGREGTLNMSPQGKERISNALRKNILQYTLDGKLIKEWNKITQASKEIGTDNSSIGKCCRQELKSAGGFIWRYKDSTIYPTPINIRKNTSNDKKLLYTLMCIHNLIETLKKGP